MTDRFIVQLQEAASKQQLVKITFGYYKGEDEQLKQVIIKPILLKQQYTLSFTYRYKTKDITKNYSIAEATAIITAFIQTPEKGFGAATLFTTTEQVSIQYKKGKWKWQTQKIAQPIAAPVLSHDRNKERKINSADGKGYLHALGVTDAEGKVYKNAQDKYKQINHYIELLSPVIKQLETTEKPLQVVDMGSGKGYLTFALADYLTNQLAFQTNVIGVEYRKDMVELCNGIAAEHNMPMLHFEENTIQDYKAENGIDVIIALHACDTATDDAIAKGIGHDAQLIVVAPCCHKQIRRSMEAAKQSSQVDFLVRYGVFMERQAEMITDGLRALILEYYGYQVKVFAFVDEANTPKNVMITALKGKRNAKCQEEILAEIKKIKADFGIDYHHLERILGL